MEAVLDNAGSCSLACMHHASWCALSFCTQQAAASS